jgi:hypothetical protein
LGQRILQEYPALHQFDDPVSPRIEALLRKPFPVQKIAIMGVAKRWQQARTAMVVAECQVFAVYTQKHDVTARLQRILSNEGFRTAVLRARVDTSKREARYAR